jgi:hypothetical protein
MAGAQKNVSVGPALEYVGPLTAAIKLLRVLSFIFTTQVL